MPNVLITPEAMLDPATPYAEELRRAGFEVCFPRDPKLSRGLAGAAATVDALRGMAAIIAGGEQFTRQVIESLPELRVIARAGVGFDRVDLRAATERGVAVTITPTANHEAVAEHAVALLLAVAKSIVTQDQHTRAGGWHRFTTRPLRGRTLGIVGLGRIGRSMAVRGRGLSMGVIAYEVDPDRRFAEQHDIELVDLDTLLSRSDYVSIHCPLNDSTRGMFSREVLQKMKPDSVLINTSRGDLVVEADLVDALRSGHLGAAGLDVFEQEPPSIDNPLFSLPNVVVSPHLAGGDVQSIEDMGTEAARSIITLRDGGWPVGSVVNDELRGSWRW